MSARRGCVYALELKNKSDKRKLTFFFSLIPGKRKEKKKTFKKNEMKQTKVKNVDE